MGALTCNEWRWLIRPAPFVIQVGDTDPFCRNSGFGYAFADQWETLSDLAGNLTGALIGLLALVAGSALAYRARRRRAVAAQAADLSAG